MEQYDPRIDAYIGKKPAFAQPILKHVRELMHATSPLITETIKWGHPFFEYKGTLANLAAFKEHCAFGFWNASSLKDSHGVLHKAGEKESAGNFGRITRLTDLPGDEILKEFILQAIALNEKGKNPAVKKAAPAAQKELVVPDYFIHVLSENPAAEAAFEKFSYSHKKEYLQWITEAKTDATRQKRMEQSLEMMSEGKSRHWKYAPQPPKGGA